jgi:hypothetical protein
VRCGGIAYTEDREGFVADGQATLLVETIPADQVANDAGHGDFTGRRRRSNGDCGFERRTANRIAAAQAFANVYADA